MERRRDEGAALIVAIMLMVFMGIIGLTAMETVTQDRQIAGVVRRTKTAFFASEAGASTGLNLVRTAANRFNPPALPTTNLGTTQDFPYGQPSYLGDPTVTPPIRWLKDTPMPGMGLGPGTSGFVISHWAINVQGNGPNGGVSRLELGKRMPSYSGFGG